MCCCHVSGCCDTQLQNKPLVFVQLLLGCTECPVTATAHSTLLLYATSCFMQPDSALHQPQCPQLSSCPRYSTMPTAGLLAVTAAPCTCGKGDKTLISIYEALAASERCNRALDAASHPVMLPPLLMLCSTYLAVPVQLLSICKQRLMLTVCN